MRPASATFVETHRRECQTRIRVLRAGCRISSLMRERLSDQERSSIAKLMRQGLQRRDAILVVLQTARSS